MDGGEIWIVNPGLAPVRVRVKGGEYTLSWMCNLAEERRNRKCFYAKAEKPGV